MEIRDMAKLMQILRLEDPTPHQIGINSMLHGYGAVPAPMMRRIVEECFHMETMEDESRTSKEYINLSEVQKEMRKEERDKVKLELVELTDTAKNAEAKCRDMIADHNAELSKRDATLKKKKNTYDTKIEELVDEIDDWKKKYKNLEEDKKEQSEKEALQEANDELSKQIEELKKQIPKKRKWKFRN